MSKQYKNYRKLKKEVLQVLQTSDWQDRFLLFSELSPQKLISPLFSSLLSANLAVKWHAVSCFGRVVSHLAEQNLEKARVVMRRFIWGLNDESGGIGWGNPESMAEIMACQAQLAQEYHKIFISFFTPRSGPDNYLEYMPLRRGAYWGAARLAQARPDLLKKGFFSLAQALKQEKDAFCLTCILLSLQLINSNYLKNIDLRSYFKKPDCNLTLYWDEHFYNDNPLNLLNKLSLE